MRPIGPVLRRLREGEGLSQIVLAARLNEMLPQPVSSKVVSSWERDVALPNANQLLCYLRLFGFARFEALYTGGEGRRLNAAGEARLAEYFDMLLASDRFSAVPAKGNGPTRLLRLFDLPASAGTGQYLEDARCELVEVDDTVPLSADFGVRLAGDSMEPRFMDGQIAWVHEQPQVNSGEIGIFFYDGNALCKRFEQEGGTAALVSLNEKYPPLVLSDGLEFRVFGKVVGVIPRFTAVWPPGGYR